MHNVNGSVILKEKKMVRYLGISYLEQVRICQWHGMTKVLHIVFLLGTA